MESFQIAYVNVFVTDLPRAVAFYEKTLGLELQFCDEKFGYASVAAGPVRMGLARVDPKDEQSRALLARHTGVGFRTRDLRAAHADLLARGVSFPMEPEKQPWGGFMALFADPDGNVFYLDEIHHE
jgi:predicted enzyme related to lactoylglutathione lyase